MRILEAATDRIGGGLSAMDVGARETTQYLNRLAAEGRPALRSRWAARFLHIRLRAEGPCHLCCCPAQEQKLLVQVKIEEVMKLGYTADRR